LLKAHLRGKGGGLEGEGKATEILESTLDEALAMIDNGKIIDAKAILLLHCAERAGRMCGDEI
jgi:hypothetical protein